MPLTHGSITLREFTVEGEVPRDLRRAFDAALQRYAFRPIAVEKGETRSIGWVNPRQVLDSDPSIEKMRMGPWVLLALRQDRMALNARLFRARRDLALSEAAAKAKKTRLSKNERQVIEDAVRLEMLRRQTPSTQIIEAAWRPDDALAYVAASSEAAVLTFSEMFGVTFGLGLAPAVAGMRAIRWAERKGVADQLSELTPTAFAAGSVRRRGE
jgi:DNA recombination-dependent growth factor C